MPSPVAIIGGTGVYTPGFLTGEKEITVSTPYGEATLQKGKYRGLDVVFLARHGRGHSLPPHRINYRANIWALKELEVRRVLATAAVGSLRRELAPGQLVLVDQFLDFTKQRPLTFYEGVDGGPVVHTDFTEPYCPELRSFLLQAAPGEGELMDGATYVCTEGPRFETPAEIAMFSRLGGDLVGMTGIPEAVLAREAGLCYATVAMVTNYAAGLAHQPLTHQEVVECMASNVARIRDLFARVLTLLDKEPTCSCAKNSFLGEGDR